MTMKKALNPEIILTDYMSKERVRRELVSIEVSVDASIQRFDDYIEKVWRKTDYSHQKQY